MNLPNKLTVLRVILVPVFAVFLMVRLPGDSGETLSRCLAAFFFVLAALTDLADGKIARKYDLVTDFGKFMDPLADKFMIFAAILGFAASDLYREPAALHVAVVICGLIVIFRELAVTSMRLVVAASREKVVVAANWYGKAKTTTQCVWVVSMIVEPLLPFGEYRVLSWITVLLMAALTILSGITYLKEYWRYLDPNR